ncbi:MAG: hypothetical protein ACE5G0_17605 [Rhodothermales bacterium]
MKISILLPALVAMAFLGPASTAQTLSVSKSARLHLLNGGIVDLGTTTMLVEQTGGLVTGGTGVLTATRTLNAPNGVNVAGLGATITSSINLSSTVVTRGHEAYTSGSNQGIARYFAISPTTNTGLNATLVFHYDESELGGAIEVDLRLFRSTDNGVRWTQMGGVPDPTGNTVTLTGIDAFSHWTLAGEGLLPVELVAFEAFVDGDEVTLTWATASETNNAGFEVEREMETGKWKMVGFVEGHGTTLERQTYAHRIEALEPGRYVYRLKQIDFDGTFEYSPEVEVSVAVPGRFYLSPAYPNPFNPKTQVNLAVAQRQRVQVAVYDGLGRRVASLYAGMLEADQTRRMVFEAGGLPSGLYVIRAVGETFSVVRSVMLIR